MEKQIDIITELLIDFDEMGFAPTTTVPNPEAYAIEWRKKITEELKGYRKASDVAREIFAEIEKEIKLALESNYKAYSERMKKPIVDMADEFIGWVDGKITALRGIEDFIADLKKKYESEGEK